MWRNKKMWVVSCFDLSQFPPLCVLRVCWPLSSSPSWFILGVLRAATTTPASNPLVMASGTVSMINTLARSALSKGHAEWLTTPCHCLLSMRLFYVCVVPGIIISVPLCFSVGQITQEDIRKTYGGSSGSRGYYSSAFARSVVSDVCLQHLVCCYTSGATFFWSSVL